MLHWSDSSDFDFSVKSKQVLKEADLLSGRQGRGESAGGGGGLRAGERRAAKRKESGNKAPSYP